MIRILYYEFLKVVKRPTLWLSFLLLLIINVASLRFQEVKQYQNPEVYASLYQEKIDELQEKPLQQSVQQLKEEAEILGFLNIVAYAQQQQSALPEQNPTFWTAYQNGEYDALLEHLSLRINVNYDILRKANYQMQYHDTIKQIIQNSEQMLKVSIFNQLDSFSRRNIEQTANDYARLQEATLVWGNHLASERLLSNHLTDVLILILIGVILRYLLQEEKSQNLLELIKVQKFGKRMTVCAKLLVLSVCVLIATFCFYLSDVVYYAMQYGYSGMDAPIQSSVLFSSFTVLWSVGKTIVCHFLWKLLFLLSCSYLLFLLFLVSENAITVLCVGGVFLLIQLAFYLFLPAQSLLANLRWLNFFSFLDSKQVFYTYTNLRMFALPIPLRSAYLVTLLVLAVLFVLGAIISYCKNVRWQFRRIFSLYERIKERIPETGHHVSLLRHEAFKTLVTGKVALVLLCFFLYIGYTISSIHYTLARNQESYRTYIRAWHGVVNEETIAAMQQEENLIAKAETAIWIAQQENDNGMLSYADYYAIQKENRETAQKRGGFELLQQQVQTNHAKTPMLVDRFAYEYLFEHQIKADQLNDGMRGYLLMILVLTVCLVPLYSVDQSGNISQLYELCKYGQKKRYQCKYLLGVFISITVFLFSNLRMLVVLKRYFYLSDWTATLADVPNLYGVLTRDMPLWVAVLAVMLIRLAAVLFVMSLTLYLGRRCKHGISAMVLTLLLVLTPTVLLLVGVNGMQQIALSKIFVGNGFFRMTPYFWGGWLLILAGYGILS